MSSLRKVWSVILKRLFGHKTSKILHFFDVFSAPSLYFGVKNHKKTMVSPFRRVPNHSILKSTNPQINKYSNQQILLILRYLIKQRYQ